GLGGALQNPVVGLVVKDRHATSRPHDARDPADEPKDVLDVLLVLVEFHPQRSSRFRQDRDRGEERSSRLRCASRNARYALPPLTTNAETKTFVSKTA